MAPHVSVLHSSRRQHRTLGAGRAVLGANHASKGHKQTLQHTAGRLHALEAAAALQSRHEHCSTTTGSLPETHGLPQLHLWAQEPQSRPAQSALVPSSIKAHTDWRNKQQLRNDAPGKQITNRTHTLPGDATSTAQAGASWRVAPCHTCTLRTSRARTGGALTACKADINTSTTGDAILIPEWWGFESHGEDGHRCKQTS